MNCISMIKKLVLQANKTKQQFMKKIFKYVPIILGLVMVMSSCGDDEEDAPDTVSTPSLNISVNSSADQSSYTVAPGDAITLAITAAKADRDLDLISISQNGANVSTGIIFTVGNNTYDFSTNAGQSLGNADDETLSATGTFTDITSNVGITTYSVKVTDKDGVSTTKSFDIVVEAPATPLATTVSGAFYHIAGTEAGAWNISTDMSVSLGTVQTGTVLTNNDVAGDPFTGSFDLSTGSTMVIGTTSDYTDATVESAEATYNAGTSVTANSTPAVGDVYVVKMENGNYAVISITALDPDDTTSPGNKGIISFDYKKN